MSCLLFAGCKDATKEFESLADRACSCAEDDAACGSKVLADLVTFAEHNKTSDGDQSRITQAGIHLNDCLTATGVKQKAVLAALEQMIR